MTDWSAVLVRAQAAANVANTRSGVNLKGKSYLMVANRVEVFRQHFGVAFTIDTQLVSHDEKHACVRASILDDTGRSIASGYALENYGTTPVNKGNYLENCETSAIGRALAAFGLHGGEYSSVNELEAQERNVAALAPAPEQVVEQIEDTWQTDPEAHYLVQDLRNTQNYEQLQNWHRETNYARQQIKVEQPEIFAVISKVLRQKQEQFL